MKDSFSKYLSAYAEQEVKHLVDFPLELRYSNVLVIPAYKESANFIEQFCQSALSQQNVLVVVVINQPDYEKGSSLQLELNKAITSQGQLLWHSANCQLISAGDSNSALLTVDRFTQPIPQKQGVGLARKIGVDLACYLIQQKVISTQWVHSTDADAKLPNNYFSSLYSQLDNHSNDKKTEVVAACYNFNHHSENVEINQATKLYEMSMRYYVAGLQYAGSAYSFFTIGSIITFNARAYAQVRGFPKRSAGEDFYLLNKLAKLGEIAYIADSTIELQARVSDRVPFGTGPAVDKIIQLLKMNQNYVYYHPQVFNELKLVIDAFPCLYEKRNAIDHWFCDLSAQSRAALIDNGFLSFIEKHQKISYEQFNKQLLVWFDAFKTLKFIHHLRDNSLVNIELSQAIELAPFKVS